MRDIFALFLHAIVIIIRLARPRGLRSVVAESVLAATPSPDSESWSETGSQPSRLGSRHRRSWLSFIDHAKDSLWSLDLFRCESAILRTYWVLVVMDQFTRRIVGFAVHRGVVDGLALCR